MHSRSHTWYPGAPFLRVNCHELPLTAVSSMLAWASIAPSPPIPPPPPPPPRLPSICISHAVLTAPLERYICPNQRSLLSLKMRLRSSSLSFGSSSLDLTVTTSFGLILQICLFMALSLHCRLVFVSGQVSLVWSMALRMQDLYTWPQVTLLEIIPSLPIHVGQLSATGKDTYTLSTG